MKRAKVQARAPGAVFSPAVTPGSGSSAGGGKKTVPQGRGAATSRGCGRGGARLHAAAAPARVGTPALRRLARRGGVKRISAPCYDSARDALRDFLRALLGDCVTLVQHKRRHTVVLQDVLFALKRHGRTLYGWAGDGAPRAGRPAGCAGLSAGPRRAG
jgi:histone H4